MMTIPASVRPPAVAGTFYPDDPANCRHEVQNLMRQSQPNDMSHPWVGALLPHAGWICSGQVAADGINALARSAGNVDIVVIFGAVHTVGGMDYAALDEHQRWSVPTGMSEVAMDLQRQLLAASPNFRLNPRAHMREHAIEVNLPFVQQAFPNAVFLPIEVPPIAVAAQIGRQTARIIRESGKHAVFLASSDLTHYGPNYDFTPAGLGLQGIDWAMDNDRRVLDLIQRMEIDRVVDETQRNFNACGGGAIAATLAACHEMGSQQVRILRHTNSYETLLRVAPQRPDNSVGYAAVLLG